MPPAFSIAIPYHHNPHFLVEAVQSVAMQTYTQWELIISADTEIPGRVIDEVKEFVPEAKIINNKNPGMANNWNHCIALCTKEYVVLLHSDDKLKPDYLTQMSYLISKHTASAWFCGVDLINEKGKRVTTLADTVKKWIEPSSEQYLLQGDQGLANLLRGCFIYCPSLCYRTEVIRTFLFSSEWKMVADLELYGRLLKDGHAICGTKQKLFEYRRHKMNQTSILTKNTERFIEEINLYNLFGSDISFKGMPKTQKAAKKKSILRLHILFQLTKSLLHLDFKHAVALLKLVGK